ncbi:MAG: spermidine synthase [Lautropia sp.]|nr:spermidine synthase [Lautropia sp.]
MSRRKPPMPVINFSELDGIRYLHFGSPWVQGAMSIRRPNELVLPYIQDMMAWLLFMSPPARILQLGLGAASLTRWSHRKLPDSAITVVEISPQVVNVTEQWFNLPLQDGRLDIVIDDAARVVGDPANRQRFGVVQVDLYDQDAAGPVHDSSRFYRHCRQVLQEPGIMAVNLFGRHASFARSEERIREIFPQVLLLEPREEGNLVLLALNGPPLAVTRDQLDARAALLEKRFRLPASHWAQAIARQLKI